MFKSFVFVTVIADTMIGRSAAGFFHCATSPALVRVFEVLSFGVFARHLVMRALKTCFASQGQRRLRDLRGSVEITDPPNSILGLLLLLIPTLDLTPTCPTLARTAHVVQWVNHRGTSCLYRSVELHIRFGSSRNPVIPS